MANIYEVGIKNRKPKTIEADKFDIDYRGCLIFYTKKAGKFLRVLVINAGKWDYIELGLGKDTDGDEIETKGE